MNTTGQARPSAAVTSRGIAHGEMGHALPDSIRRSPRPDGLPRPCAPVRNLGDRPHSGGSPPGVNRRRPGPFARVGSGSRPMCNQGRKPLQLPHRCPVLRAPNTSRPCTGEFSAHRHGVCTDRRHRSQGHDRKTPQKRLPGSRGRPADAARRKRENSRTLAARKTTSFDASTFTKEKATCE